MKTMKKLILSALVVLTVAATALAGNVAPSFKVTEISDAKKVNLEVVSGGSTVNMQIVDDENVVLFDETVENSFLKTLNLENLPIGAYTLIVTTPTRIYQQPLQVKEKTVEVNTSHRKEYFLPVVRMQKNHVDVSVLNQTLGNVEVAILDENGDELFTETFRNQLKVERRYDVSNLEKGTYIVRMKTPAKTIYEELIVK